MTTYLRRDDWVTDAQGNAISGASVYVCSQPATTTGIPPSPLTQLYADSAGVTPITQPVITDGYGHAYYYASPGTYTVVYYSPQISEVILPDQNIGSGNVSFPITVAEGGTNATTAAQALINLGAAASGANADITSLVAIPNTTINSSAITCTNVSAGNITTINLTAEGPIDAAGTLLVGDGLSQATPGKITSFSPAQAVQIGTLGSPGEKSVIISSGAGAPTTGIGLLAFDSNYFTQTTVGAAGTASALPGVPRGYLQFVAPDGTICVLPFWKAS